jgi:glycosyltransferase involved in cell wall biosynthesis
MKHVNHQIRNILKCDFVETVVISNHNPDVAMDDLVRVRDKRVIIRNQPVRRGCGYRWNVALEYQPDYLIVVDDDILLFPSQLAALFDRLVSEPAIPHGFAGMVRHFDGRIEYREMEDLQLDYLCEIYALTGEHVKRYMALRNQILAGDPGLANILENSADFMLVSRSGSGSPKIHKSSRMFRCPTYDQAGVAVHKDPEFDANMMNLARTL